MNNLFKLFCITLITLLIGCTKIIPSNETRIFECDPSEFSTKVNLILKEFDEKGIVLTNAHFIEPIDSNKVKFVISGTSTNSIQVATQL